ncbi:hypothetical protein [Croceicoccus gelatinilyticus]|uniref:hypothetical protein n=1 Tax=Croceicoccus gelatinilyticus TaxID=2835536 RepID=UPI001BCFD7AE|nr:hypothetical protein [Croceicoccus gelatinilyticus]MBS7671427.1 hypothetical protein [Croceicoccus gelatinilyticus]
MHAIIKSSELISAKRWDARFHILADKHKADTEALRAKMTTQEAREVANAIFDAIPLPHRQLIEPLVRTGQTRKPGSDALRGALHEYPHLSIVIFEAASGDIAQHLEAEARKAREAADAIEARLAKVSKAIGKRDEDDEGGKS